MLFTRKTLIAIAFGLIVLPAAGSAQDVKPAKLAIGTWTGTVTPPNEEVVTVTFEVAYRGDTLAVTLNAGEHGSFKLEDLTVLPTKISFAFTPGPRVVCALNLGDTGAYAGDCTDDGGEVVPMTMVPPAKEPKS